MIEHTLIPPRTPYHNGKVEQTHRNNQRYLYDWEKISNIDDLNCNLKSLCTGVTISLCVRLLARAQLNCCIKNFPQPDGLGIRYLLAMTIIVINLYPSVPHSSICFWGSSTFNAGIDPPKNCRINPQKPLFRLAFCIFYDKIGVVFVCLLPSELVCILSSDI